MAFVSAVPASFDVESKRGDAFVCLQMFGVIAKALTRTRLVYISGARRHRYPVARIALHDA
jgi:hypothetical protein